MIGTASRPETTEFARRMGVSHVVDHREPLAPQVAEVAPDGVDFVFSTAGTDRNLAAYADILNQIARLVDAGILTTTATTDLGTVNAEHLREAHRVLESGRAIGKITLAGF
ncbi:zinc-binding dehydrogenase [Streptomyces sparsogenes]